MRVAIQKSKERKENRAQGTQKRSRFSAARRNSLRGVLLVSETTEKAPGAANTEASSKGRHASRPDSKGATGIKALPEITVFVKSGGPLTKRISLSASGSVASDGSACLMSGGTARRVAVADIQQFAALIGELPPNEALALGALRAGLPDQVKVVTKAKLLNGGPSTAS
jgi:hypothetical protein